MARAAREQLLSVFLLLLRLKDEGFTAIRKHHDSCCAHTNIYSFAFCFPRPMPCSYGVCADKDLEDFAELGKGSSSSAPANRKSHCWRTSLARRPSATHEDMIRDRQINLLSFKHGLSTLGFKLAQEVTEPTWTGCVVMDVVGLS